MVGSSVLTTKNSASPSWPLTATGTTWIRRSRRLESACIERTFSGLASKAKMVASGTASRKASASRPFMDPTSQTTLIRRVRSSIVKRRRY